MKKVKSFKDYFKPKRKDRSFKKAPVFKDSIEATQKGYLPGEKFYKERGWNLIEDGKMIKHHTPCTVALHPIKGSMGNGALSKKQILAAISYYKLMGKEWLDQTEQDTDTDNIRPASEYVRWRIYGGSYHPPEPHKCVSCK